MAQKYSNLCHTSFNLIAKFPDQITKHLLLLVLHGLVISTPAISVPSLKFGDRGSAVAELQRNLSAQNFNPGPQDGVYGNSTMAAVKNFQQKNGLEVDGIAGDKTQSLLQNRLSSRSPILAQTSELPPGELAIGFITVGFIYAVFIIGKSNTPRGSSSLQPSGSIREITLTFGPFDPGTKVQIEIINTNNQVIKKIEQVAGKDNEYSDKLPSGQYILKAVGQLNGKPVTYKIPFS